MSRKKLVIDWNRFDGYSFQEMCNHLLVAENINVVPLRAGPYADGGQDAFLIEGAIVDLHGKFIFQAKYHQPRPGAANYNVLKKELKGTKKIKGELDKAEELKANHLVLMANVPLTIRQQKELMKLAEVRPFRLHIWDEEKIKALLVKQPYVRFFHIQGPEYPMFVPPQHFFEKLLKADSDEILTHLVDFMGREKELEAFRAFLSSRENILSIFAPPGQGKSRLVLEFSKVAQNETGWIPLFLRPDGKLLEDHLEELNPHLSYLIFLDDAHQHYNRLKEFLTLLHGGRDIPKIKLVLAARTSLSGLVKETLGGILPSELKEIRIIELSQEVIVKILKKELPFLNDVQVRDLLPYVKDSPLLAVSAARLIKLGKSLEEILKPGQLRRLLFEFPLKDLSDYCSQKGEDLSTYRRILVIISAIQPISLGDKNLLNKINQYLSISEATVIKKVDKLIEFGFLKKYGRKVRINPEVLSDVILEDELLTSEGESTGIGEKLAEYFFALCLKELLDNLSDVGQISFKDNASDILERLFQKIEKDAKTADNYMRDELITKLKVVGNRRANNIIRIIEVMIRNPKDNGFWTQSRLLGKISDLLGIVAYNYEFINDALEIQKNIIINENVDAYYDNHKPEEVVKNIVGYDVGKPIKFQEKALQTLVGWKDHGIETYTLAVRSISAIFPRTITYHRSYGASMTIGNFLLSPNSEVISLRRNALDFLAEALNSGIKPVQLAAVKTASEIGRVGIGPSPRETRTFDKVIENERLTVIDEFEGLITAAKPDFLIMAEIEKLLWQWWCSISSKLAQRCFKVIGLIHRTPEYELFKYLHIPHSFILPNLCEANKKKTSEEKNKFVFNIENEKLKGNREFIDKLISEIGRFDDYEYWAVLLDKFVQEADNHERTGLYGIVLAALAGINPELGKYLYEGKKGRAWENYGPSLLSGIRETEERWWVAHILVLIDIPEEPEETAVVDCIYSMPYRHLSQLEIEFLRKFSLSSSERIRETIAAIPLRFMSHSSWYLLDEIAGRLIQNSCTPKALDEICCCLIHDRPEELSESLTETERKLLPLLTELENFDGYWCKNFIAKFAIKNPRILLDFVIERLAKGKTVWRLKDVFGLVAPEWRKSRLAEVFEELSSWVEQGGEIGILGGDALKFLFDDDGWEKLEDCINPEDPLSIVKAAKIASNYPKDEEFYAFFAKLLNLAQIHGEGVFEEVSDKFLENLIWRGEISRKIGEPSQRHVEIIKQCERILQAEGVSREARKVFGKCLSLANRELERERLDDEEVLGD